ncbi:MAG TPA: hypothetical protein VF299_06395 [Mycobacterium sp.]
MVRFARGLTVLAAAAVTTAALGAPSAAADDPAPEGTVEGIYTFSRDGESSTWKITPLCVPIVGDGRIPLELAAGCKLQVESYGAAGQSGLYSMVGGRWTYSKSLLTGLTCSDGKGAATIETYQFDPALNGQYTQSHNAVCGMQPALEKKPFTLTFVSPLPNPPIHYPLTCQDNPIHLCS